MSENDGGSDLTKLKAQFFDLLRTEERIQQQKQAVLNAIQTIEKRPPPPQKVEPPPQEEGS